MATPFNNSNHTGCVVRYNITQNDCRNLNYGSLHIWGKVQNAEWYNNTIYLTPKSGSTTDRYAIVIVNDYELELLRQKTGLSERDILDQVKAMIVTRGEHGSSVLTRDGRVDVPAVPPHRIVDPTGVGDAFRGGLMKGMARGQSLKEAAQVGTVAATWALEHLGGQSHAYTMKEFSDRYAEHFGTLSL